MLLTLVTNFLNDDRTLTIGLLIFIDLVTGLMSALRRGSWQWKRVADFYRTLVLPGVLGYLLVYVLGAVGADHLPALHDVILLVAQWGGAGLLGAALFASIGSNVGEGAAPRSAA